MFEQVLSGLSLNLLYTTNDIEINIEPTDKVQTIKERVEETEGIYPAQQRLLFNGQQMKNDKTVADYMVTEGSVLFVIYGIDSLNVV